MIYTPLKSRKHIVYRTVSICANQVWKVTKVIDAKAHAAGTSYFLVFGEGAADHRAFRYCTESLLPIFNLRISILLLHQHLTYNTSMQQDGQILLVLV